MAGSGERRAIIVGAGPAGLSAAVGLQRVGIHADVYEQSSEMPHVGLGLGIQSNALRALERLGIGQTLRGRGVVMRRTEVRTKKGKLLLDMPQGEVSEQFGTPTISLTRADLQEALIAALGPGAITLGSRCVGLEQDEGGVTVHFANGREERAALVIGADGARSAVAKAVLESSEPDYSGFTSWRGVVAPPDPLIPEDVGVMYIGRGRANVMFPIPERAVYFGFLVKAPARAPAPADLRQQLRAWFSDFSPSTHALIAALEPEQLLRADIYDRIPAETWFKGRVVLAGDAIHPTTPFVGQGAGIAIEDSVVLVEELALTGGLESADAIALALSAYQGRRLERTRWIVKTGRLRGRLFGIENTALALGRDLLLRALPAGTSRKETEKLLSHEL